MHRRTVLATASAALAGASAGCLDAVRDAWERIDDVVEEPDASGVVHRSAGSFEVEAEDGDEIFVSVDIRDEGSGGRGELRISDPDGTEIDSTRFGTSGPVGTRESYTADQSGTYSVTVDPRNDRDVRLRVSVSVRE